MKEGSLSLEEDVYDAINANFGDEPDDTIYSGIIAGIKWLMPEDMTPNEDMQTQNANVKYWLEDNPGKTRKDWAQWWLTNAKHNPISAIWDGAYMYQPTVFDGHHRLLAATILNVPVKVQVKATRLPKSTIQGFLDGMKEVGFNYKTGKKI